MERRFVIGELATLRARMILAFNAAKEIVSSGKPVEVIVRNRKSKRSTEQNRRYWAILRDVSESVWLNGKRYPDEVWHEQFKRMLIGMEEIPMPDGTIVVRGISTATLDVAAFGQYMERIEQWCVEQGFPIMEYGDERRT